MYLGAVRSRMQKPHRQAVLAMAALVMAGLGVWCGWTIVGDYMLAHRTVEGRIQGARVLRGTRSPNTYQVIIDHQSYNITRDLLARLRPDDIVEADVGIASGTILAIRSAHPASQGDLPRQAAETVRRR
jgi:hypothetical protein